MKTSSIQVAIRGLNICRWRRKRFTVTSYKIDLNKGVRALMWLIHVETRCTLTWARRGVRVVFSYRPIIASVAVGREEPGSNQLIVTYWYKNTSSSLFDRCISTASRSLSYASDPRWLWPSASADHLMTSRPGQWSPLQPPQLPRRSAPSL